VSSASDFLMNPVVGCCCFPPSLGLTFLPAEHYHLLAGDRHWYVWVITWPLAVELWPLNHKSNAQLMLLYHQPVEDFIMFSILNCGVI